MWPVPSLRHHIRINAFWIPIMFATTWIIHFVSVVVIGLEAYAIQDRTIESAFLIQNLFTLDSLLNNMMMFHTIYTPSATDGNDSVGDPFDFAHLIELSRISSVDSAHSNTNLTVYSDDSQEPLYWISMPACHPFRATNAVIERNRIRDYIVTNSDRIQLFERYSTDGFVEIPTVETTKEFRKWYKERVSVVNGSEVDRSRTPGISDSPSDAVTVLSEMIVE